MMHLIDRLRSFEDHADMIQQLTGRRPVGGEFLFRDLMQRKIVGPGAEIDIVDIRLPHHPHAEELLIKRPRACQIRHPQCHMSEPTMERTSHKFLSWPYSRWASRSPSI